MTGEELETLIEQKILTGGRRTRAQALREVLNEMVRSSVGTAANPITSKVWITEDERLVLVTIDGTNQWKITDIT
jgi:hypothetical protein